MELLNKIIGKLEINNIWNASANSPLLDEDKLTYYAIRAWNARKKKDFGSLLRNVEEWKYYSDLVHLRNVSSVGFGPVKSISDKDNLPKILEENNYQIVELFSSFPKNGIGGLARKYHRKMNLKEIAGYFILPAQEVPQAMAQIKNPLPNSLVVLTRENQTP